MVMKKKISVLLLFCLMSLMPLGSDGFDFGCMRHLFQFQPCSFQVFNMKFLGFPISNTCCNKILHFANSGCPPPLPYGLFMQSKNSCVQNSTPPPSRALPTPAPPSSSRPSQPPPPPHDNSRCIPSTDVPQNGFNNCNFTSCYAEMLSYKNKDCPVISDQCCEFIPKVVLNCPKHNSGLTLGAYQYCVYIRNRTNNAN
ncbi:hypothetical protein CsatA_017785 [Cannabis sativa]